MQRKVIALVILAILSVFLPKDWARIHNYLFTSTVPLITAFVSFLVYLHSKGEMRLLSLAVCLSSLLNWLGEVTWNLYEILGYKPTPSLADVFWMFAYIPIIMALLKALKRELKFVDLKGFLFASILTAFIISILLLPSSISVESLPSLEALVDLTYIALDAILFPVVFLLVYVRRPLNVLYMALILSVVFMLIGDVVYAYFDSWGIYYTGSLPDVFYNLQYLSLLLGVMGVYGKEVRVMTVEEIESDRRRLELLNKLMRHDILNDLSAILGYLEIYEETKDEELLKKAKMRAENSIDLIKAIRVFDGKSSLEPVNLKEIVEKVVRDVDAEIVVDVPELRVLADELIFSALRNVILNAVRHCDGRPRIEIKAWREDGWVVLDIADNGPGIPPELREKIFEEGFGRHMGLGLFLVREIVKGYGGTIEVMENSPKGSIFRIRLIDAEVYDDLRDVRGISSDSE